LGYQIATGQSFFDVGEDYEKNKGLAEDIGQSVVSFLTLSDMGTLIAGGGLAGGIANIGYKQAAKQTIKQLVKKNISNGLGKEASERIAKKTVAQLVSKNKKKAAQIIRGSSGIKNKISEELAMEIVEAGAKTLPSKMMTQAIGGAGGLGFYGGLQSGFGQELQTGDISAVAVTKDAAINAGLGFVTAGSGSAFGKYLSTKLGVPVTNAQKIAHTTAKKALETSLFGTATPVIEGRAPTAKDYIHAAGVIGGLTVAKRYRPLL